MGFDSSGIDSIVGYSAGSKTVTAAQSTTTNLSSDKHRHSCKVGKYIYTVVFNTDAYIYCLNAETGDVVNSVEVEDSVGDGYTEDYHLVSFGGRIVLATPKGSNHVQINEYDINSDFSLTQTNYFRTTITGGTTFDTHIALVHSGGSIYVAFNDSSSNVFYIAPCYISGVLEANTNVNAIEIGMEDQTECSSIYAINSSNSDKNFVFANCDALSFGVSIIGKPSLTDVYIKSALQNISEFEDEDFYIFQVNTSTPYEIGAEFVINDLDEATGYNAKPLTHSRQNGLLYKIDNYIYVNRGTIKRRALSAIYSASSLVSPYFVGVKSQGGNTYFEIAEGDGGVITFNTISVDEAFDNTVVANEFTVDIADADTYEAINVLNSSSDTQLIAYSNDTDIVFVTSLVTPTIHEKEVTVEDISDFSQDLTDILDAYSVFNLVGWNAGLGTAGVNSTVNASRLLASGGSTNQDAVIQPKGAGALLAQIPNGAATGGNKRGANAVDLQTSRDVNTQVASGIRSVIGGGNSNTASGLVSTVVGGNANTAAGEASVCLGGDGSLSDKFGMISFSANGQNDNVQGANQLEIYNPNIEIDAFSTGGSPSTFEFVLTLDGESASTNNIIEIKQGCNYTLQISISAIDSDGNGLSEMYFGNVKNIGGTLSGNFFSLFGIANEIADCTPSIEINNTNKSIEVTLTFTNVTDVPRVDASAVVIATKTRNNDAASI